MNTDRTTYMAATPRIIVVGGGLAGLAAVIKIAEVGGLEEPES
jgi:succinate dehydrogenase/fumarate reductase flavoprotein subunit